MTLLRDWRMRMQNFRMSDWYDQKIEIIIADLLRAGVLAAAMVVISGAVLYLGAHPAARDARAIFQRGVFRPVETWLDSHGRRFNPGNYYYVGGNSKFYGAVLIRYRERLEWQIFGEVFNVLNTANLSGYADNLLAPGFGQPTARFSNVFGTGGPRAFQLGTRISF